MYKEQRNKVDSFLRMVRIFTLGVFALQVILIAASILFAFTLTFAISEKYLVHPAVFIVLFAILLIPITIRSVIFLLSQTESQIARRIDRDNRLRERLSTYVEIRKTNHPFRAALVHETEDKLVNISTIRAAHPAKSLAIPFSFLLTLVTFLVILPYLPVPETIQSRKYQQRQILKETKLLQDKIDKLQKQAVNSQELKKTIAEFEKAVRELQKPDINKAEALKKLNAMQEAWKQKRMGLLKFEQKRLAEKLKNTEQSAIRESPYSDLEKQDLESLAREMQDALGEVDPQVGEEIRKAVQEKKFTRQDIERFKKALEDFKTGRTESEKQMTELQRSLQNAQKGIASQKNKVIFDSKLNERQMDKSKGGVEDGPGTTNLDIGPQHFDIKKKGTGEYAEDRTKAEFEQLYKGQRENVGSDPFFLNSEFNDSDSPKYIRIRSFGSESQPAVQSNSGSLALQKSEESEIRKEKIPASYRNIVKQYFESIEE